jgi:hypothetical protein
MCKKYAFVEDVNRSDRMRQRVKEQPFTGNRCARNRRRGEGFLFRNEQREKTVLLRKSMKIEKASVPFSEAVTGFFDVSLALGWCLLRTFGAVEDKHQDDPDQSQAASHQECDGHRG